MMRVLLELNVWGDHLWQSKVRAISTAVPLDSRAILRGPLSKWTESLPTLCSAAASRGLALQDKPVSQLSKLLLKGPPQSSRGSFDLIAWPCMLIHIEQNTPI
jgi:hypothetical protein